MNLQLFLSMKSMIEVTMKTHEMDLIKENSIQNMEYSN